MKVIREQGHLVLPLISLIGLMFAGFTPLYAAVISIFVTIGASWLRKDTRMTPDKILAAVVEGSKSAISVGVCCVIIGVIIGTVTLTSLGLNMGYLILSVVNGGSIYLAGFLVMIMSAILGMGVPTTANYCIMASTCAPILVQMGFPLVAAHFFVFYFGIVADITPPVALAAYAGSAIAKSDPMKTGINATKLAIAAFIVPYIFAYSPALLFENISGWWEVAQICVSALLGIFGIAAALNGHLFKKVGWPLRILLVVGGLGMMIPGTASDVVGLVVVGGIVLIQRMSARKLAA